MYKDIETETSYKYLKIVISSLKEPICILGGWAVFFAVNKNYQKQALRVYIGSRDIDIGFNSVSSFKHAASILENRLKFKFVSFRYYKNVHAETGKDLSDEEVKSMPQHMYFQMYVDPIMSYANSGLKSVLGFTPIDEPLLKYAFEDKKYGKYVKEFGRKLLLPAPEILLATKICSAMLRDKEHKRYKDICDITALCLFAGVPIDDIIKTGKSFASKNKLKKFSSMDFAEDIKNCSNTLGLEFGVVKSVINKIKEK
ncbi:hypothetical protein J4480_03315 [Candidatus Woesearchaeota archaeon]|nr:hypothetical protein [Candidatus Woesearchaeota archaeon]